MNSVLQALFLSDDFRLKLMASKSLKYRKDGDGGNGKMAESEWTRLQRMVQSLQSVFGHLQCTKRRAVSTRKFVDLLPAPWTGGRQQDAAEFTKFFLDVVWETVSRSTVSRHWNGISDSVDPFFGGTQRNVVQCGQCGKESIKMERFTEIPLSMERRGDIINGGVNDDDGYCLSTKQMIYDHFGAEKLEGENMYFCSECGHKVVAQRSLQIVHAPKHLILCFKRFSWNFKTMKRIKRNEAVNCPLTLELPIHPRHENSKQRLKADLNADPMDIEEKEIECESAKYVLYSAVIHSGKSAEFGHYYTIGRHVEDSLASYHGGRVGQGTWFMFNDRTVSKSSYNALCGVSQFYKSDVPYILFYRLIDDEIKREKEKEDDDDDENEDENEWKQKVQEDNRLFDQEMAKFAASKSTFQ